MVDICQEQRRIHRPSFMIVGNVDNCNGVKLSLVDSDEDIELGEGEAKKLIIEVTADDLDS